MRIGIDGNEANVENRVGVHQYAFEILHGLYEENNRRKEKHNFIIYLKNNANSDLPKENSYWKYKVLTGGKVWIITRFMPYLLLHPEVDVLFVPSHYTPLVTRFPVVCTIHDLGYLESMEQFKRYDFWQLKIWTAKSISKSKNIIAVSDSTKNDIVRHYKINPKKIRVVPHGFDRSRFNTQISKNVVRRVKTKYGIKDNYILFLSTLKPSKNLEGLLRAFKTVADTYSGQISLVVAGKKGWLYDSIFNLVKQLNIEDKVIFTGFVPEEDKAPLYYGSEMFVLPAFWEGFGMTALEAMACGSPVAISKVGGLPEVVGNAGVYVDPQRPDDIADKLLKVLSMSEKDRRSLVKKGIERSKKFDWQKAAKQTLDVLYSTYN